MKTYRRLSILFVLFVLILSASSPTSVDVAKAGSVTVNCTGTAGAPTDVNEAAFNPDDDVTFADAGGDGYCELSAAISVASVTVDSGVVLTHAAADTTGVDISATGNITINGDINVDEKGYPNGGTNTNGTGPGAGLAQSYTGGGASHAGAGGNGCSVTTNGSQTLYGSSWPQGSGTGPTTLGSGGGGGYNSAGGDGGGAVKLSAGGTLTMDGDISADAEAGEDDGNGAGGGGSGGSIYIVADTLSGAGTYSADGGRGGNGTGRDSGGGGGGYIYVEYNSTDIGSPESAFENMFSAMGGTVDNTNSLCSASQIAYPGNNGSVIIVDKVSEADFTDADVYVYDGALFRSGEENGVSKFLFNNLYAIGTTAGTDDAYILATGSTPYVDVDGTLTMSNVTLAGSGATSFQLDGTTVNISSLTADDTFSVEDAGDWTFNVTNSVTSILDNLTISTDTIDWNFPAGNDITITDSSITATDTEVISTFTIDDALDITLGSGDDANLTEIYGNVDWSVDNVTIYSSSLINADYYGYAGPTVDNTNGTGPGAGIANGNCGGGASHAGAGGDGSDSTTNGAETLYGSSWPQGSGTGPTTLGSGGGGGYNSIGGDGGGAIKISVNDTFTMNGDISVDGEAGEDDGNGAGGGGSGGSIYISADAFSGTGTYSANGGRGGNGTGRDGGGGGGGYIYVEFNSTDVPTPSTTFDSMFNSVGGTVDNTHSINPSNLAYAGDNGSVFIVDKASQGDFTDADVYTYDGILLRSGEENGASRFQFNDLYAIGTTASTDDVRFLTTSSAAYIDVDGTLTMSNATLSGSGVSSLQLDADTVSMTALTSDDTFSVENVGDWVFNITTSITSTLDNLTVTADTIDWDLPDSTDLTITNSSITATGVATGSFAIDASSITLGSADSADTSDIYANVDWVLDSLTVYQGSSIDATGLGYSGATTANADGDGPGAGDGNSNNCGGGAGHGGAGGVCTDGGDIGPTYDDTPPPTDLGSGGGSAHSATATAGNGGRGGGVISIDALSGTVTLNGSLIAGGDDGTVSSSSNGGGGGAGGSVYVQAGAFVSGASATINTTGGAGGNGGYRRETVHFRVRRNAKFALV